MQWIVNGAVPDGVTRCDSIVEVMEQLRLLAPMVVRRFVLE
jgi:hypothetical protein